MKIATRSRGHLTTDGQAEVVQGGLVGQKLRKDGCEASHPGLPLKNLDKETHFEY